MIENQLKASNIAFRATLAIVWAGAIFINEFVSRIFPYFEDLSNRYALVMILIAFAFAIGIILSSYLAYRYDSKE